MRLAPLKALRGPSEGYSDVNIRVARDDGDRRTSRSGPAAGKT